ncbi:MAG: SDR family NAD(P)-dependent oxidoreductase, partial [Candidatus Micrarchaeota archaeon]
MESKVAAITGAYSGLGSALSRILAKNGYKLVIGGRNEQELKKFADQLKHLTSVAA